MLFSSTAVAHSCSNTVNLCSGHSGILGVLHKYNADFTVLKKQTQETVLHRLILRQEQMGKQHSDSRYYCNYFFLCLFFFTVVAYDVVLCTVSS